MTTNTGNTIFKLQIMAIILMSAGWGWTAGNFSPQDQPLNALAHAIPIVLLLVFGVQFFQEHDARQRGAPAARWGAIGLSVVAILNIIAAIVFIVLGMTNPDPTSIGVHSFNDWIPSVIMLLGDFFWLATLLLAGQGNAADTKVSSQ